MVEDPKDPQGRERSSLAFALEIGLTLLVCAVAISNQSFWIDECGVAQKALLPDLKSFWHQISSEGSADLQQPFHHVYAWAWEKVFGVGEISLRAGNIPFLLIGITAVLFAFQGTPRFRGGIVLAILTSPFVWYYLNEARPYAVQIGASLVVFSSLYKLSEKPSDSDESVWVWTLCFGMVLLAMSGMLAMLWLGGYILAARCTTPLLRLKAIITKHVIAFGITALLLLGMGLFYLWTLSIGARATAVGGTDLRNLGFILFEILGFGGVGPGRLAIRNEGLRAFVPWIPWIGLYGLVLLAVLIAGLRRIWTTLSTSQLLCWPMAFTLVGCFILAVGVAAHFRVLGRHCTPVLPLVLFVLGSGATALWSARVKAVRTAVVAFACMASVSCLMVRFAERHAKDDYRSAASIAREFIARGELVWWSASPEGAGIYGIPLSTNAQYGSAIFVANPEPGFSSALPKASLVVSSKPDVYDANGALSEFLKQNYKPVTNLIAFTLWQKQN